MYNSEHQHTRVQCMMHIISTKHTLQKDMLLYKPLYNDNGKIHFIRISQRIQGDDSILFAIILELENLRVIHQKGNIFTIEITQQVRNMVTLIDESSKTYIESHDIFSTKDTPLLVSQLIQATDEHCDRLRVKIEPDTWNHIQNVRTKFKERCSYKLRCQNIWIHDQGHYGVTWKIIDVIPDICY